ncbi:MAG: hypothetical protein KHY62_02720 [Firmicutes bacterium]|nr:hypothetical protein [Bacillota bacterium]
MTGYDSVYMTHSFPLAGRADGGKRKEPHDGKKSSHTDTTETRADFCVHAALGRLRFVSGSTAQLLYLVDFSISGTGVRVKIHGEKSVRVGVKNTLQRGWGLRFERRASTASVCTLAENDVCHTGVTCCLASTSGVATHRKNGRSELSAGAPFFSFGSLPNP